MKATHRLIDSVWTVEYNVVSPTEVEIIKFTREDQEGYDKERELPQCAIIEGDKRTFIQLLVKDKYISFEWVNKETCDHTYTVTNPRYIFNYK